MPASKLFRYEDGAAANVAVIAYAGLGWAAGIAMICAPAWPVALLGTVLLAHALIVSAYLIHECTHGTIFARPADNDRLGTAMAWINGACIGAYAGMKEKHLRHHADRMDVVTFDYRQFLRARPSWVRRAVLALEWAYVPAVEFIMRGMIIAAPFIARNRPLQLRMIGVLALRACAFAALGAVCPRALLLYALAYLIFLHVLRFQDAFQHTFEVHVATDLAPLPASLRPSRVFEHENTYSDVVSLDMPWANLLLLNFSYHNAHHARPAAPWFRLKALHEELYVADHVQVLPCRALLASYHRHRVRRVLADDYGTVAAQAPRADGFMGAVGVSFLTAL
jgi:fatty acid desaturase